LKRNALDDDSAVIVRCDLLLVRSLAVASVQCACGSGSEEVCCVHVTLALFDLRSLLNCYFYKIPRYAVNIG